MSSLQESDLQRGAAQARFVKQRQIEITKVPRRNPSKLGTRGRQIEAVLSHCRIDANAVHAYYDDSQGFVVYAEGGGFALRRYRGLPYAPALSTGIAMTDT